MLRYTTLEIRRMLREPRFAIFTVVIPLALFLVDAGIFKSMNGLGGISVAGYLMISMAAYGAISAALSATGARLAQERHNGWLRQLDVTPLSAWSVVGAKTLAAMTLTLPATALVYLVAALTQGVAMPAWQWAALVAVGWVGSLPFAALGVLIGSAANVDTSQPLVTGVMFFLAIFGGIFIPLDVFPRAMARLAGLLPSTRYAEIGRDIVAGHAPALVAVAVLVAWTAVLCAWGALAYRRATVRA
ncbi:MAG: ABC transporter permease [Deinococcales bacterium]